MWIDGWKSLLSTLAEIAPSTTSAHLTKLVDQGLIKQIKQGRYRYYCLMSEEVAKAVETLMTLTLIPKSHTIKSSTPINLRLSRSCYNHLAGTIAVNIAQRMKEQQWISGDNHYILTDMGSTKLHRMGFKCERLTPINIVAHDCLDWSERKFHLSGQLGKQLLIFFEQKEWISRYPQTREVIWTMEGKKALQRYFDIDSPSSHER